MAVSLRSYLSVPKNITNNRGHYYLNVTMWYRPQAIFVRGAMATVVAAAAAAPHREPRLAPVVVRTSGRLRRKVTAEDTRNAQLSSSMHRLNMCMAGAPM